MTSRVLICGVSTRAAAASAAGAGFAVTAVDAFADLDQHPDVRALSVTRDFGVPYSAAAVVRAARTIDADAVAYLSNLENHPRAVRALGSDRMLWGNAPAVLRQVRDPFTVAATLARCGFAVPALRAFESGTLEASGDRAAAGRASHHGHDGGSASNDWLIKPRASGGGHGVRRWNGRDALPRGSYLQQRIDGTPGSIVFVAARGRAVPLAITEQLVGDAAFGVSGYRYCGNVLLTQADGLLTKASALAQAVAAAFPLVGVNGIDFIVRDGVPLPIEINPRWTASMELAERAFGLSVFAAHAAACATATLPSFDLAAAMGDARVRGKAVVFARHAVVVGDTDAWREDPTVHDVPHAHERIAVGRPVCTVSAAADTIDACRAALAGKAMRIHTRLDGWRREAA
jgi:predicted ATP-grasp superfamily ATP-dependent carboligase